MLSRKELDITAIDPSSNGTFDRYRAYQNGRRRPVIVDQRAAETCARERQQPTGRPSHAKCPAPRTVRYNSEGKEIDGA